MPGSKIHLNVCRNPRSIPRAAESRVPDVEELLEPEALPDSRSQFWEDRQDPNLSISALAACCTPTGTGDGRLPASWIEFAVGVRESQHRFSCPVLNRGAAHRELHFDLPRRKLVQVRVGGGVASDVYAVMRDSAIWLQSIKSMIGRPVLRGCVGQSLRRPQYSDTTKTVGRKTMFSQRRNRVFIEVPVTVVKCDCNRSRRIPHRVQRHNRGAGFRQVFQLIAKYFGPDGNYRTGGSREW